MLTAIALVVLVHVLALAGVLLAARYDSQLVDEQGHVSLVTADTWQEQVVPVAAEKAKAEKQAVS